MCNKATDSVAVQEKHIYKKVVVVGPASVGKTTIINQLINGESRGVAQTTRANMYQRTYNITLQGHPAKLTLKVWDTPGGAEYANMRDLDFSGADACIMVYAIDKETTFNEMPEIK